MKWWVPRNISQFLFSLELVHEQYVSSLCVLSHMSNRRESGIDTETNYSVHEILWWKKKAQKKDSEISLILRLFTILQSHVWPGTSERGSTWKLHLERHQVLLLLSRYVHHNCWLGADFCSAKKLVVQLLLLEQVELSYQISRCHKCMPCCELLSVSRMFLRSHMPRHATLRLYVCVRTLRTRSESVKSVESVNVYINVIYFIIYSIR